MTKRFALTTGEPAGIGPDLAILLSQQALSSEIICIGCEQTLKARADALGIPVKIQSTSENELKATTPEPAPRGLLKLLPTNTREEVIPGRLSKVNGPYVLTLLDIAIKGCLNQTFDGVITAPVQKSVINEAGFAFTGHTEYFAEKTHTEQVVMLLASQDMRVATATTHLPLSAVPAAITRDLLIRTLEILVSDLKRYFGCLKPRILVAGLNPHAGESGHLGREEIDTIIPAMAQLDPKKADLIGPLPADTLFTPKYLKSADAVLVMYHDQGLPVLKYQSFGQAANITLGLPVIRTSVDHGTALDLAGTGKIDSGSLQTAIRIAEQMANNRQSSTT